MSESRADGGEGNRSVKAVISASVNNQSRCWTCGSVDTRPWRSGSPASGLSSDDLRITDSRYGRTLSLSLCRACGFRFADTDEAVYLATLYEGLQDPEYEDSQEGRRSQMRTLVGLALATGPGAKTALDVGAASGLLVAEAERAGLEAVGIEPSRALAARARDVNGANVLCGVLPSPQLTGRRFDIVFLVDVIEHVADPIGLLSQCIEHLAEDGILLLVTPDMSSLSARLLGHRCWHYRLAHVGYFDRLSLETAFSRVGLRALEWHRPVWYFSVSYLATRLESYLPVRWLNRLAQRIGLLRRLYELTLRIRIPDSHVVLAARSGSPPADDPHGNGRASGNPGAIPLRISDGQCSQDK